MPPIWVDDLDCFSGRKREGRVVLLVTKGAEEEDYKRSQSKKKTVPKAILAGASKLELYHDNPRMVPDRLNPKVTRVLKRGGGGFLSLMIKDTTKLSFIGPA